MKILRYYTFLLYVKKETSTPKASTHLGACRQGTSLYIKQYTNAFAKLHTSMGCERCSNNKCSSILRAGLRIATTPSIWQQARPAFIYHAFSPLSMIRLRVTEQFRPWSLFCIPLNVCSRIHLYRELFIRKFVRRWCFIANLVRTCCIHRVLFWRTELAAGASSQLCALPCLGR